MDFVLSFIKINRTIMKLYTEEQLKEAFHCGRLYLGREGDTNFYHLIDRLTPTEMPSDEEIDAHVEEDFLNSIEVHKYSEEVQLLMKAMCKAGMKCMRDKIQGGIKC